MCEHVLALICEINLSLLLGKLVASSLKSGFIKRQYRHMVIGACPSYNSLSLETFLALNTDSPGHVITRRLRNEDNINSKLTYSKLRLRLLDSALTFLLQISIFPTELLVADRTNSMA
jgi:hypothetical protein